MKNDKMWTTIGILFVVAVVMLVPGLRNYYGLKSPKDLTKTESTKLKKNQMVHGTAQLVWDCYCSEVERDKITQHETENSRWYLVPYIQEDQKNYYISVKVRSDMFSQYDRVCEATWAFLDGDADIPEYGINYQGRLKPIKGDVKKRLEEYIGANGSENKRKWEEAIVPYYVDLTTSRSSVVQIIVGSIALAFSGLLFAIVMIKNKKEKKYFEKLETQRASMALNHSTVIDDSELDRILSGDVGSTEDSTPIYAQNDTPEENTEESAVEEQPSEDSNDDDTDSNSGNWVL